MSFEILSPPFRAPFYAEVACGLFGISDDFTEKYLSLDEKYLANKESTFFVRAGGDSMLPEIKPGDILIVDRSIKLESGRIGTFYYNGSAICKQYLLTGYGVVLHSFNPRYKDIVIRDEDQLELFGVVIGIARDLD